MYIQKIYIELQQVEKDRLQAESITTAYLTDCVLSIVHSLYGSDKTKYKSQPQTFLPGYVPEEEECGSLILDVETGRICGMELSTGRIPTFAMAIIVQVMAESSYANQQATEQ
jgi:hypothetical protein